MKRGAVLAALLVGAHAGAQKLDVQQLTLANGMDWLIVEQHDAPVFTGYVRVRAGGLDEAPGEAGLAHLFEHLAFKGTPVLGTSDWAKERPLLDELAGVGDELTQLERSGQGTGARAVELRARLAVLTAQHRQLTDENALLTLYKVNGAVGLNATTDKDLTSYFASFPKNRLELWLLAEAQRLAAPVLRDFHSERAVVEEERRSSTESSPAGLLYEELNHLAFVGSPYRWPTIGYTSSLRGLSIAQAHAFFEKHYTASNAVGCIVGDVTVEQVKPLLERTFGLLPLRPRPSPPKFSEPAQRGPRRAVVSFDANPRVMIGFQAGPPLSRTGTVLDVIEALLSDGNSARLNRRLVFQERLAQSVGAFSAPGWRLDNLFVVSVVPLAGVTTKQVEDAVWDELRRLATEPLAVAELEKAKGRLAADVERKLMTNRGTAHLVSNWHALFGDWRELGRWLGEVRTVTPEEVARVSATLFVSERSNTIELVRRPGP